MPHFGGSLSSLAQTVQKLWAKIGLGQVAHSQNLDQNWPITAKIAGFSKKMLSMTHIIVRLYT